MFFRFYILLIWPNIFMSESNLNEKIGCWDPHNLVFRLLLTFKKKMTTDLEKVLFKISFLNLHAIKFIFCDACVYKFWQMQFM